jgi:hypothetical protein
MCVPEVAPRCRWATPFGFRASSPPMKPPIVIPTRWRFSRAVAQGIVARAPAIFRSSYPTASGPASIAPGKLHSTMPIVLKSHDFRSHRCHRAVAPVGHRSPRRQRWRSTSWRRLVALRVWSLCDVVHERWMVHALALLRLLDIGRLGRWADHVTASQVPPTQAALAVIVAAAMASALAASNFCTVQDPSRPPPAICC